MLPFGPDLVLACLYLNDVIIENRPPRTELSEGMKRLRRWTRPERKDWVRTLRDASVLVDLVCDSVYIKLESKIYNGRYADVYLSDGEGWQRARAALSRMHAACQDRGIDFALLLYPQLMKRGEHLASHEAYAVVRSFAEEAGMRVFDLEEAFVEQDIERLWVHPRDLHPNGAGHHIAARAMRDYLVREGLVPVPERSATGEPGSALEGER